MSAPVLAAADVSALERILRALGEGSRLRIVALLAHGELCVCHLERALQLPQSTVSRQLGLLRAAGVVAARREGSWVHYRLARPDDAAAAKLLAGLRAQFRRDARVAAEVERLRGRLGPGACT